MKLIPLLLFPLSICALKLPRYRTFDDGTQDLETYITAFLVNEDGKPQVECWSVSSSTETMEVKQKDGSIGTAHRTRLAAGDDLAVEIHSWPPYSPIWPEPGSNNGYKANQIFSGQNLFNVTDQAVDDDEGPYYFGPDNGDDWFYFEDTYVPDANKARAESPFTVESKSGGNTQLLSISHSQRPPYKKVHDGPCSYTGVRTPPAGKSAAKHIELNVQIEEL